MRTTEVKKKKYNLTQTEASAIREVLRLLSQITNDDDICDNIQNEACAGIGDTEDILNAILSLDDVDLEC